MYCPRCGKQTAIDVQFCSGCGLALNLIGEAIAKDGEAPSPAASLLLEEGSQPPGRQPAAKLMFFSAVLVPVFLCLGLFKRSLLPIIGSFWFDGPTLLLIPSTLFFLGLVWMLYTRLFGDKVPAGQGDALAAHESDGVQSSRPVLEAKNVFQFRDVSTAEIVEPPSVTDRTTRLLE